MRYLKLFEGYLKETSDETRVKSYLEDIFVELKDIGFKIKMHTDTDTDDSVVFVNIELTKESFIYGDIKDYILMALDFLKIEFTNMQVNYSKEAKVILYGSKTYINSQGEPSDTDEICSIKIYVYKE